MKSVAIAMALATFFLITNCSNSKIENKDPEETGNKDPDLEQNSIIGKWQLVERFDGGSPVPNLPISDGYTITFLPDGKVSTTEQTVGCPSQKGKITGTYSLLEMDGKNAVVIEYPCSGLKNDVVPNVEYYFGFNGNDSLRLTPTLRTSTCWEGCSFKFKKVIN